MATHPSGTMSDDLGLMPQNRTVRTVVVSGVLAAIQLALGITGIGFIPLPTGVNATILHIPAILAGVMEGRIAGLAVGGIFGLFSSSGRPRPCSRTRSSPSARLLIGVVAFFDTALRPFNEVVALPPRALGTPRTPSCLAVVPTDRTGVPYLPANVAWTVADERRPRGDRRRDHHPRRRPRGPRRGPRPHVHRLAVPSS